jgi:hypothetical protein
MNDTDEDVAPSLRTARLLRVLLRALGDRFQVWAALMLGFALFSAAAWRQHWIPLAGGAAFALFALLLVRRKDRRDG